MKLLFLCNTLYQLIGASCIRSMFPDDRSELILSDHSTGNKKVYESFQKYKVIFDRVYYLNTKYLYEYDEKLSKWEYSNDLRTDGTIKKIAEFSSDYDMFFCANAEPFSTRIVNYILHSNRNAVINWFEDGLSAYSFDKRYFLSTKERVKSKIKGLFGIYGVTSSVRNYYVFHPEKMEWKPKAIVKQIRPMSKKLADDLGTIFDYKHCVDKYNEKYIFFEDGSMDWSTGSDIELVNEIANIVGKENIIVKIHPRNPVNRFKELGYKTNQDTSVPWEVIASNIDIQKKILITLYSQSIVTPEILLGENGTCISLAKLDSNSTKAENEIFDYINRQYFQKNKERYYVPKTHEELKTIFREI